MTLWGRGSIFMKKVKNTSKKHVFAFFRELHFSRCNSRQDTSAWQRHSCLFETPGVSATSRFSLRFLHTARGEARNSPDKSESTGIGTTTSGIIRVKSWPFELLSPFGKLTLRQTPFSARIVPTNPHDYPAADRVFVHLLANPTQSELDPKFLADVISGISCSQNKDGVLVQHTLDEPLPFAWVIEVPTCYDIQVTTVHQGHISVENLENEMCTIQSDQGDIELKSMKSAHVSVESNGGNVSSIKSLQGSGKLTAKKEGMLSADRLQGLDFEVSSEEGPIHIKDIYARKAEVHSERGPISISNMHTDCHITTAGHVKTGCVQGSMSAVLSGDAAYTGYLSQHDFINIQTERGDIEIRVSEECQSHVHLTGQQVDIDGALVFLNTQPSDSHKMIGQLNGGGVDAKIVAKTKEGSIAIKTQSWFDSLGLGK